MTRLIPPVAVLVITIAGILAFGAWNRADEPVLTITLTERELARPWNWNDASPEDRGVPQMSLRWHERSGALESRNWLGEDSLRAMGFLFPVTAGDPRAERTYNRTLPRVGWVVFEYDGPAWHEMERRRLMTAGSVAGPSVPRTDGPELPSRLVPVAAGPDFDLLASRHSDGRHLVLPAVFALDWVAPADGGPLVYGALRQVVSSQLTVPAALRPGLGAGTYEVDVAVGRAGLPWIRDIRPR